MSHIFSRNKSRFGKSKSITHGPIRNMQQNKEEMTWRLFTGQVDVTFPRNQELSTPIFLGLLSKKVMQKRHEGGKSFRSIVPININNKAAFSRSDKN